MCPFEDEGPPDDASEGAEKRGWRPLQSNANAFEIKPEPFGLRRLTRPAACT
jgi:hypothetical protein